MVVLVKDMCTFCMTISPSSCYPEHPPH